MYRTSLVALVAAGLAAPMAAQAYNTLDGSAPLIIGHRGASGYKPEHTLESYVEAIRLGANYIEPDLVLTKDGVLLARHEPVIGDTTNVKSLTQFAGRKTTKTIDSVEYKDNWFVEDFTLAELKQLRAIQTRGRSTVDDGKYEVPTLAEIIAKVKDPAINQGRTIGIYPELKHSTYMRDVSLAQGRSATYFEDTLVATLHAAYGNSAAAPVFIQSFEVGNLQYLNTRTDIRLVQLIDANDVNADGSLDFTEPYDQPFDQKAAGKKLSFADMVTEVGLRAVASYADGIGPWKPYLLKTEVDGVDRTGDGVLDSRDRFIVGSTGVIENAHAAGLLVHAYTFRDDANGSSYGFANGKDEMSYYMKLGVDGVFTDFPDTGVAALAAVPEPQTYAMMFAGLGVVLWLARRRRAAGAA